MATPDPAAGQAPAPSEAAKPGKAEAQAKRTQTTTRTATTTRATTTATAQARAEVAGGPETVLPVRSLAEAAEALGDELLPLPNGGPGVGAAQVAERREGYELRQVGSITEAHATGAVHAPRVPAVTKEVLPRTDRAVDPDTVPGHRYARATGQVRRDGLTYQAGKHFKVDFRAHGELLVIGSIEPTPWSRLPVTNPDED